jgi:hypothetical protein
LKNGFDGRKGGWVLGLSKYLCKKKVLKKGQNISIRGRKMKKLIMLAMVLGLLVSGCAITTNCTIKEPCNFTEQFKTVRLEVKDEVNTPYSKAGVEEFKSILTAHLGKTPVSVGKFGGLKVRQGLGYQVVTENEDLLTKVSIVYFQPDNKALRIIVGWGAGKGGLKYVAEFSSKGKILATLEGGKSYGDVNVFGDTESTIYRGGDSTRSFMIMHSVLDIGDFLRGENRESKQTPQVTEAVVKPMVAIPPPPIVEQRPPKEEGTITSREEAVAKREEAVAKREEAVAKREGDRQEEYYMAFNSPWGDTTQYHRISCPYGPKTSQTGVKLSKEQIKAKGLKPCPICKPLEREQVVQPKKEIVAPETEPSSVFGSGRQNSKSWPTTTSPTGSLNAPPWSR